MQYVARQPILDGNQRLRAYELLFRDSFENRCNAQDLELASRTTIDTAVLLGLDTLSDGHEIFLNCTHDLIVDGLPTLFPSDLIVVEVLESARASPELVQACRRLRRAGYRVALDDFVPQPGYEALIDLADVIKVDFRTTPIEKCAEFADAYGNDRRQLLAEKVETGEEFRAAIDLGYSLFQGYLFSRPNVLSTSTVEGLDANQQRIFRVLSKPTLDFVEVESLIKTEPALCYRLLRFLNSPAFYLQSEIRSILHALTLLGEQESRKWLLLASAVLSLKSKRPHLLSAMLVRARFSELLGQQTGLPGPSLFILGMLSLMDAALDVEKSVLADKLAVSEEIREALKGESNPLERCLELVIAFETAEWSQVEQYRQDWRISADTLSCCYMEAVRWAKRASDL